MSNSFGTVFRVTTWGESHGPALGAVIDGCPAGLPLDASDIRAQLDRDVPDQELGTPRGETNRFEIMSGLFEGRTIGTPISIIIWNNDARPLSYEVGRDTLRPGHADYTWLSRFGHTDYRGGSRSSGRECIARLAAGAVAGKLIGRLGIGFAGKIVELAGDAVTDAATLEAARQKALRLGEQGDSTGGVIEIHVSGVPAGIGRPVFGKIQSELARAFLSIGGVKGLEIGQGFEAARMTGSEHNDPFGFAPDGSIHTLSNTCGGVLGGITTGGELVFRLAVKPTPTIQKPQQTVNVAKHEVATMSYKGRFDRNFTPRVIPIAEAMAACVLADHLMMSGLLSPCRL
ncbi:MAG TPA: chorismate synthase [Candidatus Ozemobacteraceae bacterium]|mgnify:CR=1 FL=1|nr:chorismate synthase [Candidatus Ozemobacteraceae bacterium]